MDRTEVTVKSYAERVQAGACRPAAGDVYFYGASEQETSFWSEARNARHSDRMSHPGNCVTWSDADEFCRTPRARRDRV